MSPGELRIYTYRCFTAIITVAFRFPSESSRFDTCQC